MQVGSLYRYFDGALLDAVPNQGPVIMGDGVQPDAPQHQVIVSDFWIYGMEVANQMYAWCVSVGKCSAPDASDDSKFNDPLSANNPVVGVHWQQASDYCGFVHGSLPTEAQWEEAASWDATAKTKRLYPWGAKKPSCNYLNFAGCASGAALASTKPCPDPVIQLYNGCAQGKTPVNYVTIQNTAPTIVTVTGLEGCTPGTNDVGATHQCKLGVTIQVQSSCNTPPAGTPACPSNYTQDPNNPRQCVATGAPGACPTGYQFDTKLQCCSIASGSNAPAPLCSVGEHLYNGMCVDDSTGPRPPASLAYVTSSGFDCVPDNPGHQCPAGQKYTCSDNTCACH